MVTNWPANCLGYALTDSKIEASALYRTLRQLEQNHCLVSKWDVEGSGPTRRLYALTARGEQHLEEWITVLDHIAVSMGRLVAEARSKAHIADSNNQTGSFAATPCNACPRLKGYFLMASSSA